MTTKRIPVFYIFLLLLVVLVVALTEIGKSYLTGVLEEYEDAQYKYVAEDVLDTYFVSGNGEALAQLFRAQISEVEDQKRTAEVFNALTEGKTFSLQSVSTGLTDKIEYVIKCDDKRFATLTLAESGERSEHGFSLYSVEDLRLNENLFFSRSVWIPVGYSLKVNGMDAPAEFCDNEIVSTAYQDMFPGEVLGIHYTKYTFASLLSEPEFAVLSPNGSAAPISLLEDGSYCGEMVFDTPIPEELQTYAIDATEAYACYLQKDARFGTVAKYLDPSSVLYENLRTSPNWMVIDHDSYAFEDAEVTQYHVYDDTSFSCRVRLTHILKYRGLQDYRDYIDITWYFTKNDGKYLIYDSYNNN